jgi:hypothetical protein
MPKGDALPDDAYPLSGLTNAHKAQLRSTLKAAGKRIGLLMNLNQETLTSGVRRVIN